MIQKSILLTGGACSGKSSILKEINAVFALIGVNCILVPECASFVMEAGAKTGKNEYEILNFQILILQNQMAHERAFLQYAKSLKENVIIIFDRSSLDGQLYCEPYIWEATKIQGKAPKDLLESFDKILILESSAKIGRYAKDTNPHRFENESGAKESCDKTIALYSEACGATKPYNLIKATENFDEKVRQVIAEVLGNNVPVEEERKFLLTETQAKRLREVKGAKVSQIYQYYLKSPSRFVEIRARKVVSEKGIFFYKTAKIATNNDSRRYEVETRVSSEEFDNLLGERMENVESELKKSRREFRMANLDIVLDHFATKKVWLAEIEGGAFGGIPFFYHADVTSNPTYKSKFLADKI